MLQEVCAGCLQSLPGLLALLLLHLCSCPTTQQRACVHVALRLSVAAATALVTPLSSSSQLTPTLTPAPRRHPVRFGSCRALITKLERIPAAAGLFISPLTLQVGWVRGRCCCVQGCSPAG